MAAINCKPHQTYQYLNPHDASKHHFISLKTDLYFPTTKGFRRKLFYQYMAIFIDFSHTASYPNSLQVENCDSNSRLVVNEDGNGKIGIERVKACTPTAEKGMCRFGRVPDCLAIMHASWVRTPLILRGLFSKISCLNVTRRSR